MKTRFLFPFLVPLAAALLWCGQAHGQDNPPPKPSAPTRAESFALKAEDNDTDDDGPGDSPKYKPYEHGYMAGKKQRVTFLGVNTAPLPEAVAAQLPLEKGTGLLVTYVAKDSPAAKAGLAANDVLVKLDEHTLVNSAQLQTLIENRQDGDAASLTYYRQGQSKTASATLATQEKTIGRHGWSFQNDWNDPARTAEFQAAMAKAQVEIHRALADARRASENVRGEAENQKGELEAEMTALQRKLSEINLPSRGMSNTFARPGTSQTMTTDDEGMFMLTRRDGRVRLSATDRQGKVLFEGEVTKPEDQAKVPASLSAKLQKMLRDLPMEPAGNVPPALPAPPASDARRIKPVRPEVPVPAVPSAPVTPAIPEVPMAPAAPATPSL